MKSREDSSQLPQDPGLIWDCLSGWHCWRGNDELAAIEDASLTCRQPQVDRTTAYFLAVSFLLLNLPQLPPQTFTLCLQTTCFISFTVRGSLVAMVEIRASWSPEAHTAWAQFGFPWGIFSHVHVSLVIPCSPNILTFGTLRSICS